MSTNVHTKIVKRSLGMYLYVKMELVFSALLKDFCTFEVNF